jgi:hypothetical protein
MIKIPYEDMKFHYTINHYDYHLEGTCWYNGKIALYKSIDETDYQTMTDTCPYCSGREEDIMKCHCENAPDVYCYIIELPLWERIFYRIKPYYSLLWFIWNWGSHGIGYWKRWKY